MPRPHAPAAAPSPVQTTRTPPLPARERIKRQDGVLSPSRNGREDHRPKGNHGSEQDDRGDFCGRLYKQA
jgi:hypothetical protein